ncbi:hypothetical protein Q0Z83_024010 [Actinoplanes sichuanensis]|nr:hypothetical protein Q0Z83_024010 [Actinoplanes sichuanensis]
MVMVHVEFGSDIAVDDPGVGDRALLGPAIAGFGHGRPGWRRLVDGHVRGVRETPVLATDPGPLAVASPDRFT